MLCRRCGKKVERGWRFCPNCGATQESQSRSLFDEIFSRFRREFEDNGSPFDKEFEVLDLSPYFKEQAKARGSGFTIKITRQGNQEPKVDVRTFGDMNREQVRRQVAQNLGPSSQATEEKFPEPRKLPSRPARQIEEPATKVRSLGNRVSVEMELPDVKSKDDIEINQLESSVEVRAHAGEKAYFKIITKPERLSVSSSRFEKGRLFLEFS